MAVTLSPQVLVRMFDPLPDVVFFIKDTECRYTHVNQTLIQRLAKKSREEIVGRSVLQLYPAHLAARYIQQDRRVLTGEVIEDMLELQLYANRSPGWCLTLKQPLVEDNRIVGLIGISRDLGQPDREDSSFQRLHAAVEYMQAHFHEPLRVRTLAGKSGVSVAQLERLFKKVFQLTPQQLLTKFRIEAATRMLLTDSSIACVGQACGFSDQSAFSRQFKLTVGMTPRDYRTLASTTR